MTEATFRFGGGEVRFHIRRNPRARRIWIKVEEPHGLIVVLPRWGRIRDAHEALAQHQPWVERALARRESRRAAAPPPVGEGATLLYRGRELSFEIRTTSERASLVLEGRRFRLSLPEGLPARNLIEAWYRGRARREIARRLDRFAPAMGVAPKGFSVRDPRTRWGSCSGRGHLSFSWRLLMAPLPVLDYLVVHELAHLRHPDHSGRFWALVRAHCPAADAAKAWLRRHSAQLHR